jgi:hypothetical protein
MKIDRAYRSDTGLSEWSRHVLGCRVYAVLSTLNPDGSPHSVPLGYAFDGERFLMPSRSTTRKVRNIEADPRARVLVQAPPITTGKDGWVAADGSADIIRGAESYELNRMTDGRYSTEEGKAAWEKALASFYDATIVLIPERWHSWNASRMLDVIVEEGFTDEEVQGWFLPLDT